MNITLLKILRNFFIFFATIIIVILCISSLKHNLAASLKVTNETIELWLTLLEIVLAFLAFLSDSIAKKSKKWTIRIELEQNSLSLENYKRFETDIENAYIFEYAIKKKKKKKKRLSYGYEVPLKNKALYCKNIPLKLKLTGDIYGICMKFSDLSIYAVFQNFIVAKYKKPGVFLEITQPIYREKKYFVRFLLLCDKELEEKLSNSSILANFVITIYDEDGKKYKKYVMLKLENNDLNLSKDDIGSRIISKLLMNKQLLFLVRKFVLFLKINKN